METKKIRKLSKQARVAKLIRQQLKQHNIVGRVKSKKASMMTSVNIYVSDVSPYQFKVIEKYVSMFQKGNFNSENDLYEINNKIECLPQVTYVNLHREFTKPLKQKALDAICDYYSIKSLQYDDVTIENTIILSDFTNINILFSMCQVLKGTHPTIKFWEKPRVKVKG